MKTTQYNHNGKEAGEITLPENVFGCSWNADLVHQVVVGMQSNARSNNAHTKDRSEVRGGGRKPYRQKGTGQARHGSRRSPIWVGGGITFGPRNERNYQKKINKKMRTKALYVALSQKLKDGKILFVDELPNVEKTSEMQGILNNIAKIEGFETLNTKKHNNVFMTAFEPSAENKQTARNIAHLTLQNVENLNVLDVLNHRYLIITNPDKSIEFLSSKTKTT